ncbi:MAG: RNA polymerase sigma factor [Candidatus Eisenbacteria bacterium]
MKTTMDTTPLDPTGPSAPAVLPNTPEVVRVLVANHRRFLSFLERRVGSREVAEDLLQDAFVRGLPRVAQLREGQAATGWFYQVLRNAIIDHHRRRGAEMRAMERAAVLSETESPAADAELHDEVCRCVAELLSTLKPEYAAVLREIEMNEGSIGDFARAAGITSNNATVRLHRARAAMRGQLLKSCGTCAEHGCLDCTCGPSRGSS